MTLPRVIVTGSRFYRDQRTVWSALDTTRQQLGDFLLVHGDCPGTIQHPGADQLAARWAEHVGLHTDPYPADWDTCLPTCPPRHRRAKTPGDIHHPGQLADYCPQAGPRRNQKMIDRGAVLLLAFPLGASHGTRSCIRAAQRAGIPVTIHTLEGTP